MVCVRESHLWRLSSVSVMHTVSKALFQQKACQYWRQNPGDLSATTWLLSVHMFCRTTAINLYLSNCPPLRKRVFNAESRLTLSSTPVSLHPLLIQQILDEISNAGVLFSFIVYFVLIPQY